MQATVTTGLLTDAERRFLRGETEVKDPDAYRRTIRYRSKERIEQIEEDLELFREIGEEELIEMFFERYSREARLEREVERLKAQLEKREE